MNEGPMDGDLTGGMDELTDMNTSDLMEEKTELQKLQDSIKELEAVVDLLTHRADRAERQVSQMRQMMVPMRAILNGDE